MGAYWTRRPVLDIAKVDTLQDIADWVASIPPERLDLNPAWPTRIEIGAVEETDLYEADFVINYTLHFDGGLTYRKVYGKFGQYVVLDGAYKIEVIDEARFNWQFEPVT